MRDQVTEKQIRGKANSTVPITCSAPQTGLNWMFCCTMELVC